MVECPVCKGISLHKPCSNDTMFDSEDGYFTEEMTEYPGSRYSFVHVPDGILKSYNAAVKTVNVDLNMPLIAIRAVLDFIETILYYIYELPVTIARLNKKYVEQEQNNKTV